MSELRVDAITDATDSGSGVAITGITSGVSAAVGEVGEVISTTTITNTSIGTSLTDVTGASLALTAGSWHIFYAIEGEVNTGATSGNRSLLQAAVYTSANVLVAATESRMGISTVANVAATSNVPLQGNVVVDISSSETYKIRGIRSDVSGTGSSTIIAIPDAAFYAVRIR